MLLCGAEDNRFLIGAAHLVHELTYTTSVALGNLDVAVVEVLFGVGLCGVYLTGQHYVVGRVMVFVDGRLHVEVAEGREETVVDALPQGVFVSVVREILIGVHVHRDARCGRQSELHRRVEVLHDAAPGALVIGAAAVALVDDDEVEEILGVLPEVRLVTCHECLEDGEEDRTVGRHLTLLAYGSRLDSQACVFRESVETSIGLVGQYVAVGEEEHFRSGVCSCHIPFGLKELPSYLEGDEGLSRTRGEGEQDALLAVCDGVEHVVDGNLLIVAHSLLAILIEGLHAEFVAPVVGLAELPLPQRLRGGEVVHLMLAAALWVAVNLIDMVAVGRIGEADVERRGVVLGLSHALLVAHLVALGLDDSQLHIAVDEHVVGLLRLVLHGLTHLTVGKVVFRRDIAVVHHAPASRLQLWVNLVKSCIAFVHC